MTTPPSNTPSQGKARLRRASFSFEAVLEDVARVSQALRIFTPEVISEEVRGEIEIGVVEALTNIVKHGYLTQLPGIVDVRYDLSEDGIMIELKDKGHPIPQHLIDAKNPAVFDFDPSDVTALPEGGMGIALLHATFDRVDYRSADGMNILTLFKQIRC